LNLDENVPFYQIRAIIRPWRLTGVLEALENNGIRGMTTYDAQGAGVQSGSVERYRGATFDDSTHALVAKTVLEVVLTREQVQDVVDIIIIAAQTGEIGDGKIFLTPVVDVVRIRTGETGVDAERMAGGRSSMFPKT
jgi:nitrogen regulatory protein PII